MRAETLIPNNMRSGARESLGIAWISRGHHDDALVVRIPMSALGRIPAYSGRSASSALCHKQTYRPSATKPTSEREDPVVVTPRFSDEGSKQVDGPCLR